MSPIKSHGRGVEPIINLMDVIIPIFIIVVLVGTVWAAGIAWGLNNRWPVGLFIAAGLAGAIGSAQPRLALAVAALLWGASFIWGSVIAWKVNKRWPAYLLGLSIVLIIVAFAVGVIGPVR